MPACFRENNKVVHVPGIKKFLTRRKIVVNMLQQTATNKWAQRTATANAFSRRHYLAAVFNAVMESLQAQVPADRIVYMPLQLQLPCHLVL